MKAILLSPTWKNAHRSLASVSKSCINKDLLRVESLFRRSPTFLCSQVSGKSNLRPPSGVATIQVQGLPTIPWLHIRRSTLVVSYIMPSQSSPHNHPGIMPKSTVVQSVQSFFVNIWGGSSRPNDLESILLCAKLFLPSIKVKIKFQACGEPQACIYWTTRVCSPWGLASRGHWYSTVFSSKQSSSFPHAMSILPEGSG